MAERGPLRSFHIDAAGVVRDLPPEDHLMEGEFAALGERMFSALSLLRDVAGTEAAQDAMRMLSGTLSFFENVCEEGRPDIIESHLPELQRSEAALYQTHQGAILSANEIPER